MNLEKSTCTGRDIMFYDSQDVELYSKEYIGNGQ